MTYHRWYCAGHFCFLLRLSTFRLLVSPAYRGITLRVGGLFSAGYMLACIVGELLSVLTFRCGST